MGSSEGDLEFHVIFEDMIQRSLISKSLNRPSAHFCFWNLESARFECFTWTFLIFLNKLYLLKMSKRVEVEVSSKSENYAAKTTGKVVPVTERKTLTESTPLSSNIEKVKKYLRITDVVEKNRIGALLADYFEVRTLNPIFLAVAIEYIRSGLTSYDFYYKEIETHEVNARGEETLSRASNVYTKEVLDRHKNFSVSDKQYATLMKEFVGKEKKSRQDLDLMWIEASADLLRYIIFLEEKGIKV